MCGERDPYRVVRRNWWYAKEFRLMKTGEVLAILCTRQYGRHQAALRAQGRRERTNSELLYDAVTGNSYTPGYGSCKTPATTRGDGRRPIGIERPNTDAAARHGYVEIVKLLLDHGADVKAFPGTAGLSALQEASEGGHIGVFQLLAENGAYATLVLVNRVINRAERPDMSTSW